MKVTYIDHMGNDLSVVNAARVSFGKKSLWEWKKVYDLGHFPQLSKADQSLIQFLARGCTSGDWEGLVDDVIDIAHPYDYTTDDGVSHRAIDPTNLENLLNHIRKMPDHWTPFGHTAITLHIKAPIFVARQLGKHQVGFVWNEVSRRYITDEPEFYVPETWRKAADNVKQGSSDETVDIYGQTGEHPADWREEALERYNRLLSIGVCPEQARMELPQSMLTEWYWTGNLYGFANVYNQRTDSHAQKEVRDVAHQIGEIIRPLYPVSWEALTV